MEIEEAPAFFLAARDGDTVSVSKMLSTAGAQSLINYKNTLGTTVLMFAAGMGHESVLVCFVVQPSVCEACRFINYNF
jgi:hypothetical protein